MITYYFSLRQRLEFLESYKMKTFNNTVGNFRSSPSIRSPHHTIHNPLPQQPPRHSEYGTLSKAVSKHLKKKKKKDSMLLQMQLQETIRRQIQSEQRYHSVDKLMFLNRQKNDQIRRHIVEKAKLQSQNEELKMLMINPSQRQLELQRKINQLQIELVKTRSQFQQKELKYKQQIEQIKRQHCKEINQIREKIEIGTRVISGSKYQEQRISPEYSRSYVQNANYVTREQSPPKRQNQYQNIQTIPVVRSNINSNNYAYVSNSNSNNPQTQTYQNNNSRSNYNISPPAQVYNIKEPQSYTNVFSQSSIRSANYQTTSPRREAAVAQSYPYKRQTSPNTTNNTTIQIKAETNRTDIAKQGQTPQEYNLNINKSIAPPTKYQQYRNVIKKEEKVAERPTTFGSEGGGHNSQTRGDAEIQQSYRGVNVPKEVGSQGITTKDIDDIYKRYYLND